MADSRSPRLSVLPSFRPSAKLVPPTTPSADFCAAVRPLCSDLSPESGTQRRSPEVRPTAFAARPPDLPPRPLMTLDFAIRCSLVRPGRPRYPVLVHRAAALLHASFRPHLAMTPLRFANPSPSSGWIEDFHLQAVDHARHTTKREGPEKALPVRAGLSAPRIWRTLHPRRATTRLCFDAACDTASPATWSKTGEIIERETDYQPSLARQAHR
jgi:hypothetical protein